MPDDNTSKLAIGETLYFEGKQESDLIISAEEDAEYREIDSNFLK